MTTWLLFTYKVPNEPSARRVYVWRKLKGLGAVLLHDTAWVLPDTPHTREKLQWLTAEVREMEGGSATLWAAQEVFTGEATPLEARFTEPTEAAYREILAALKKSRPDLSALAKRYQQIQQSDYFHSPLSEQVRRALVARRGSD